MAAHRRWDCIVMSWTSARGTPRMLHVDPAPEAPPRAEHHAGACAVANTVRGTEACRSRMFVLVRRRRRAVRTARSARTHPRTTPVRCCSTSRRTPRRSRRNRRRRTTRASRYAPSRARARASRSRSRSASAGCLPKWPCRGRSRPSRSGEPPRATSSAASGTPARREATTTRRSGSRRSTRSRCARSKRTPSTPASWTTGSSATFSTTSSGTRLASVPSSGCRLASRTLPGALYLPRGLAGAAVATARVLPTRCCSRFTAASRSPRTIREAAVACSWRGMRRSVWACRRGLFSSTSGCNTTSTLILVRPSPCNRRLHDISAVLPSAIP